MSRVMHSVATLLLSSALVACGGGEGIEEAGTAGGGTTKLLAEAASWIDCAKEDQLCDFTGTREIRYGANGTYVFKTVAGPVSCSNAIFGDPLPGVDKVCSYAADTGTNPPPATRTWNYCAAEDQVCSMTGTHEVRYGANGTYVYRTVTGAIPCTNGVFGDPLPGVDKSCSYSNDDGISPPPLPPAAWTNCAAEDRQCTFSGTREVRYGANGTYAYKTLTGPVSCSNAVFGDPLPGVDKSCSYSDSVAPPSEPGWKVIDLGTLGGEGTTATDINESGAVVGTSSLPDGKPRAFLYQNGQMTALGALDGDDSSAAVGINGLGQVVGTSAKAGATGSRLFSYEGGRMTEVLVPVSAQQFLVQDINDAGDILVNYLYAPGGNCTGVSVCNYIVRKNGANIDLQGTLNRGREINNAGVITAHGGNSREPTILYNIHDGSSIRIGSMPTGPVYPYYMSPTDMNNKGEVIGFSGYGRPFLYRDGVASDINYVIDGDITSLNALNDNGDIVGRIGAGTGGTIFFYDNSSKKVIDLFNLPAIKAANWTLENITKINNARQMIGQGIDKDGRRRAILLTPS